ncbi:hypothetical protein LG288_05940 [Idiomarina seosinensis]|uniref:hypothetical protein n=1 Tax=Idiomarina seosinensis TaxID=281739 RepID=UPI00384B643B
MFSALSAGIGLLTTWLKGKQKVTERKQKAEANEQGRRAEFRTVREKGASRFLRIYSYLMFSAPILLTVIAPEQGARVFDNLENVPDWYINTFFAMNGAVWALAETKNLLQKRGQ